jgi:hypothetical protein
MPAEKDMPSTIRRSPRKARETWAKTHDAAVEQYGEGERSHRTAFASLKHSFEKVGDHWEAKDERGPSDSLAASRRGRSGTSAGGVDANASKEHLMGLAKRMHIRGRSRMTKPQLVDALEKANDRETAHARAR